MADDRDGSVAPLALQRLAEYVARFRLEDAPPNAVALAKLALLNLVGSVAAGSDLALNPARAVLLDYLDGFLAAPRATVLFAGRRSHPQLAALATAVTAMASHTDDFSPRARTHASAVLGAVCLAIGEDRRTRGQEALAAFIAGWELAARLGDALRPGLDGPGAEFVSPTHTPVAAAVAARLTSLDAVGIGQAMALACDMGTGLIGQAPSQTNTLRTPLGASLGVYCGELAARGMGGSPNALGAWLRAYGGTTDLAPLTARLEESCVLAEVGFQLKAYPFSTGVYGLIGGLQQARRENGFCADDVEAIDCQISPGMERVYGIVEPRTPTEAHFSIGLATALALTRDAWDLADVATVPHPDPAVRRLTTLVRLRRLAGSEHLTALTAAATRVEATIRLRDGRSISVPSTPPPPIVDAERDGPTVRALYRRRAVPVLGEARSRQIEETVDRLEALPDLGALVSLLAD
jgi:2-methylcitrate dehydratase PrpD